MRNEAELEVLHGLGDTDSLSLSLHVWIRAGLVAGWYVLSVPPPPPPPSTHREDTLKQSYLQGCEYFARSSGKVVNYSNLTTVEKNNT